MATRVSNANLVKDLADGFSLVEISKKWGINIRTLHDRMTALKKESLSPNLTALAVNYIRKKIIE